MVFLDNREIGNRLLAIRKSIGMTQFEVAEAAGLSSRTYADIERGTVNMRVETILKICDTLNITPDEILIDQNTNDITEEEILSRLRSCSPIQREYALKMLDIYLESIKK